MKNLITLLLVITSLRGISQNFKPTDYIPDFSEESSTYCEQLFIEKLNKERVKLGRKPLEFDTLMAPAGDHHALYMRKLGDLTHSERVDVEGMEEYTLPINRMYRLLDRTKIDDIGEDIGTGVISIGKSHPSTFNSCADHFIRGFSNSSGHWSDLTNVKYDCIYVVIDFLNDKDGRTASGIYITVVLGKYTDDYKKEKEGK